MKVGISNYKTGTKNNWRRQCWNIISARVRNKGNATVLYLAAEQDLDRAVAVKKGFNPSHLYAVDIRREVVDGLRKQGKNAVHGKLSDALVCFKDGIDILIADFCCGITEEVVKTFQIAIAGGNIKEGGVAVFNMLRGRETGLDIEYIKELQAGYAKRGVHIKHRGDLLWRRFVCESYQDRFTNMCDFGVFEQYMVSKYHPMCSTYNSSAHKAMKFDSLIVTQPFPFTQNMRNEWNKNYRNRHSSEDITRSIAAVKAIATMRNRGKLEKCARW